MQMRSFMINQGTTNWFIDQPFAWTVPNYLIIGLRQHCASEGINEQVFRQFSLKRVELKVNDEIVYEDEFHNVSDSGFFFVPIYNLYQTYMHLNELRLQFHSPTPECLEVLLFHSYDNWMYTLPS